MLTHHALKLLMRRTGLTSTQSVKLIECWSKTFKLCPSAWSPLRRPLYAAGHFAGLLKSWVRSWRKEGYGVDIVLLSTPGDAPQRMEGLSAFWSINTLWEIAKRPQTPHS